MRLISRSLDLLELLAEQPDGLGVVRIADRLGDPPSSIHRLLAVLTARGYATQDRASRRYRLGPAAQRLGQAYQQRNRLIAIADAHLARLSTETRESVFLSELSGGHVVCVASAESPRPLSFYMRVGVRTPFNAASSARAILAFQPRAQQEALLRRERMMQFTEATPVTLPDVLGELDRTRDRGYAVCDQELESGITALSVPIWTVEGHVTASITLVAPQERLPGVTHASVVALLSEASAAISEDLGVTLGTPAISRPAVPTA